MPQVDPRVRRQYGARGPLMAQPFQNPLGRIPAVPNPWAGMTDTQGPMAMLIQQAAAQQAAARGQPQQSRPVNGGGVNWGQVAQQAAPYAQQLGQAFANPMAPIQQAYDWANRPQGANEPRISALLRNGGTPIKGNTSLPFSESLVGRAAADVATFGREMMRTPNEQEQITRQVFNSMLKAEGGTDSKGNFLTSPKGAYGPGQLMPNTAPEAYKLAGIPYNEQTKHDPNANRAAGYAYFQAKLKENNGDYAKAVAAYNAGTGSAQRGTGVRGAVARAAANGTTWQQEVPSETQGYLRKVLGGMTQLSGNFGAPAPGFNPDPYQQAMAAQDQAAALLSKPYSASFTEAAVPDRPAPEAFAAPDFTESDAAFAKTAPKNPFDDPKEKRRMQWSGYAKGIGQALASMSGNEGIGTMIMKIGGMALAGRVQGDEKIIEREEEFEKNMQEYNRALANREDGQAAAAANVMNQNIQQRNQHADTIWQDNAAKIKAKNPVVSGDKLITYDKDPTDPNKWTMNVAPLGNAIAAEAMLNKSTIGVQMGQASAEAGRFAYTSQQATARYAVGYATQLALSQGDGQAGTQGYAIEAAGRARAAVQTGTWKNMFGGDQGLIGSLESIAKATAYEKAGIKLREDGTPAPNTDVKQLAAFNDFFEDAMTATIFEAVAKAGTMDKLYNSPTGNTALAAQRSGTLHQSERVNAKGQRSTSMSWDSE